MLPLKSHERKVGISLNLNEDNFSDGNLDVIEVLLHEARAP